MRILKNNSQTDYTIDELFALSEISDNMGKSTLYRLIDRVVSDNSVKRISSLNSRKISYQYITGDCDCHLHFTCTVCNKVFHADNAFSSALTKQVEKSSSFLIDTIKTVIYGRCKYCSEKDKKNM